ncbi:hypothetical protein FOCC_FOCC008392 [Frankliniella occidentalis]|nr:hypothetical protein FOCC_FOCC008392 [Frankliniella occidentalis]
MPLLLLLLAAWPGCLGRSRLSAVDRTSDYPPCFFNPLCSCSKSVPDLGIVWCRDVPMPRAPPPLNESKALLGLERSLSELELRWNRLTAVPSNALRHLQRLHLLDLTGNEISDVSHDNWRGLEHSLTHLVLARNALQVRL